jgi:hypothetical protein
MVVLLEELAADGPAAPDQAHMARFDRDDKLDNGE